ncbi:hypothetical protein GQ457_10G007350 [Hibiscus cannabinus]
MVDGVLTHSQTAQLALEAQRTTEEPAQDPQWQQEVARFQDEISIVKLDIANLDSKMENRMGEMRTAILSELQKLIGIALGKMVQMEEIVVPPSTAIPIQEVLGTGVPPSTTTQTQGLARISIPTQGVLGSHPNAQATSSHQNMRATTVIIEDDIQPTSREVQSQFQASNFAYKLLCPKFDGTDFRGWLSKLEQYFEAEAVPEVAKIKLVMLHLEGKALQWHQFATKNHGDLNQLRWNQYLGLLRDRFAPGGFDDPFADLVALRQTDTVEQFYEEFFILLNQVQIPDDYALSIFKNHLRLEISQFLKLLQPKNLIDAFHMAKHLEAIFFPNQKRNTVPQSKHSIPSISNTSKLNVPNSSKGPTKILTSAEIDERRKKGLCFWCATKYTPGHRCVKSQLYQISVEGEGDPDEFLDCEGGDAVETRGEGPVLSLNAMWGDTKCGTMRLKIEIGGSEWVALLDLGSTCNFISLTMVKDLGWVLEKKCSLKVTVADGNSIGTLGECKGVTWKVQGEQFVSDFLVLPLKNCDVILGI